MKIFELEVGKEYVCHDKMHKIDQNKTLYRKTDHNDWFAVTDNYNDVIKYNFIDIDLYNLQALPIDTKVLVRDNEDDDWIRRYFAKYQDEKFYVFGDGRSSYTTSIITSYNYIKLYNEDDKE